ncbi:hypothetical protein [Acidocella sp.]|uniref:hypothetical protein n=1 Tax=Acidocella sp. TaxID=50710 RepID=UPI00260532DC|nr:hypothetical protein [Acidocella sp.]
MYLLLFGLAAGLNIVLGARFWPQVLAGSLNDPDSYMRLLRIEDGVRAGRLILDVARDQSGQGVMIEWSRLFDAMLWLLAAPLAPWMGWHKALFWAGVASGPLAVGALGALLGWAVEPLARRRDLWIAAFAAAFLPGLVTIALPGVVHYHVTLLAMLALTSGLVVRAWRGERWHGFMAGLAGGLAVWVTPETYPFVLMAFGALLLRWMQTGRTMVLVYCAAGFFDLTVVGVLIDPPAGGYGSVEVDRLSFVYVVLGGALLVAGVLLLRVEHWAPRWRTLAAVAIVALLLGGWGWAFPGVVEGPYGILPPAEARLFFGAIAEQRPVTGEGLVVFLFPGLCVVLYALARAWGGWRWRQNEAELSALLKGPAPLPGLWLYVALCGGVALVLGAKFLLFVGFSAVLAAALLPVALGDVVRRWGEASPDLARRVRWGMMFLVLGVPELALAFGPPMADSGARAEAAGRAFPSCTLRDVAPLLQGAAGQVVLAGPEDTPELLYRAPVLTVGSLFHHGVPGYLRDRAAWRAAPGPMEPPELKAAKVAYVLFCPRAARYELVADLPVGSTIWDTLEAGNVPPWLAPVGQDSAGWRLYRVTK